MFKSKRQICLFFVIGFLIFTVGCSQNIQSNKSDLSDISKVKFNKDTTTLVFYFPGSGPQPDTQKVLNEIEKQVKDSLNIKLDFKWTNENARHDEKVKEIFSSGMQVDVFYLGKYAPASKYVDLARYSIIKDITDVFRFAAPSLYKKFSSQSLEDVKVNGKLYAIPSLIPAYNIISIQMRKDYINKYSIGEMKTLEDFDRFLKAIKENEGSVVPLVNFSFNMKYFARMFGYSIIDYQQQLVYKSEGKNYKIIPWEQTTEFKTAVQYYASWKKSGYLNNVTRAGDAASFFHQGIVFSETTHKAVILYPEYKFQHAEPLTNPVFVFPSSSKNTELSIRFIDWVHQDQKNYDLLIYGIEGDHFQFNTEKNAIATKPGSALYSSESVKEVFRNVQYERLPKDQLKVFTETMDSLSCYPDHTGFYPDYTSIENTTAQRQKDIISKVEGPLSSGSYFPVEDIDSVVSELRPNADIVAELVQKQFTDWLKNNKK